MTVRGYANRESLSTKVYGNPVVSLIMCVKYKNNKKEGFNNLERYCRI
jgi:hypothetical protein